jgi:hypothetical protein
MVGSFEQDNKRLCLIKRQEMSLLNKQLPCFQENPSSV